jgi:hypothetical protein
MKFISTKMHGVLDLATAGTLLALPRMLGWGERARGLATNAALGALAYGALTRYEFGLLKVLPMRAHLALDALSGATLCAAPWLLLADEDDEVKNTLLGIGLFELAAAFTTDPVPYRDRAWDGNRVSSDVAGALRGAVEGVHAR